jgi:hypothetical protein
MNSAAMARPRPRDAPISKIVPVVAREFVVFMECLSTREVIRSYGLCPAHYRKNFPFDRAVRCQCYLRAESDYRILNPSFIARQLSLARRYICKSSRFGKNDLEQVSGNQLPLPLPGQK